MRANAITALTDNQSGWRLIMAEPNTNPQVFFTQLSDIAPSLALLLRTYKSRISASISTHDVINGYGVTFIFQVKVDVLTDTCRRCGETQFSAPMPECKQHKFESAWQWIADGEGKDTTEALARADVHAAKWLKKR